MKKIKMLLYGEPGVGKSVFASKSPKPFFITTDGNYGWLEDFGAKPEDHVQVNNWTEAKVAFNNNYDGYDTIVVDLLEDLFKWCEHDYCTRAKLEHVSDVGYGKGYDITRNEFFLEISKLIAKDKHVIFLSHSVTFVTKDRRGVEHTRHAPSNRIPDKVLDMIEGRLRYCLRCYLKGEEQSDGTMLKKRYISLVPKENEFGIIRGVNESLVPHDIELDFDAFAKAINLYSTVTEERKVEPVQSKTEQTVEVKPVETTVKETTNEPAKDVKETTNVEVKSETKTEPTIEVKEEKQVEEKQKPMSNAEKLAAIKEKLAALQNKNK